ncbi:cytochrome c biogenesis protein DipZ [Bosea sp. (in: a-proteobacteria)]|jgi:cytochrome c biogenesis protein CcdA/thiol-disulfide isomerase/thioredoxin|uniref:cytochrome c biogenesis protein DipZ n=1 Tax=Bosea sp. (in: a-proteobacteria) TaxID=1871050 RepID=UPI002DDDB71F|nr:cytochrome c biogenesis protein DipZ [Bosea sp. (in: a-proteobacteria)]HEV2508874.1 cytochrome c biogenesis protein DipZ [Bosea sp. (in: a-proteobacteria)]
MNFVLAYLAGVLTIASPCILPVLPFVLTRAGQPFRTSTLPMLLGMALTFAGVASLAAVAGNWAIALNHHGRTVALGLVALFGLALLFPALATRLAGPLTAVGERLIRLAGADGRSDLRPASSALLGVATGLLWTPCAGPVLGLILASAALGGPSLNTALLLFAYAAGAATTLVAVLLLGNRLLAWARRPAASVEPLRRGLGVAVVASSVAIAFGFDSSVLTRLSAPTTAAIEQRLIDLTSPGMPELVTSAQAQPVSKPLFGARQWLDREPITAEAVRGKVVLVNFWTYSCINCLRTLPYVRAWAEKYKDQGLVVVGVHTPEFAFEKDPANVRKAVAALGVSYPVAIDNDYAVWRAFGNQAWPARYFIDAQGRTRHHEFGEGDYAASERVIQSLLAEAGGKVEPGVAKVSAEGAQGAPDFANLRSPETYLGHARTNGFASPGGIRADAPASYEAATAPRLNQWSLSGNWTIAGEFVASQQAGGRINHRFHARDLHLVMGRAPGSPPVRFRVTIDGAAPGSAHGADIDAEGYGTIGDERLYQLVRQDDAVKARDFSIEFLDPGARAYAFTFG